MKKYILILLGTIFNPHFSFSQFQSFETGLKLNMQPEWQIKYEHENYFLNSTTSNFVFSKSLIVDNTYGITDGKSWTMTMPDYYSFSFGHNVYSNDDDFSGLLVNYRIGYQFKKQPIISIEIDNQNYDILNVNSTIIQPSFSLSAGYKSSTENHNFYWSILFGYEKMFYPSLKGISDTKMKGEFQKIYDSYIRTGIEDTFDLNDLIPLDLYLSIGFKW